MIIIDDNGRLKLSSPYHIMDIFSEYEKIILKDFINHTKHNDKPIISLSPHDTYVLSSDYATIKDLIERNTLL
jgi:hypothetical protein